MRYETRGLNTNPFFLSFTSQVKCQDDIKQRKILTCSLGVPGTLIMNLLGNLKFTQISKKPQESNELSKCYNSNKLGLRDRSAVKG